MMMMMMIFMKIINYNINNNDYYKISIYYASYIPFYVI